ncbi:MAG: 3'-5' exonuclease [Elainellaceae cyanobacterium]
MMRSLDLLQFYRQLSTQVFTVVDVETTGMAGWRDRITELSVLQATLADGVVDQRTSLLNPGVPIPANIVAFTGISQAMVDAAPTTADILPHYWPALNQGVLTAHNLNFDYAFLQAEYARLDYSFDRPVSEQLCTVALSRLLLADLPSRSLPNLVAHFGFNVGRSHRAAADTLACWMLTQRLLSDLLEGDDDAILQRLQQQWIPLKAAADVLNCSTRVGQRRLDQAGVNHRLVQRGRSQTRMYRRGDVEQVAGLA